MSDCKLIPGLDYQYCQTCHVWIPTDYQINLLKKAVGDAEYAIKQWERTKTKSAKLPKGLKSSLQNAQMLLSRAIPVHKNHQDFAIDKPTPIVRKEPAQSQLVFSGFSFDKDDDLDLSFGVSE
jgi:hypothetical protein